MGQLAVVLLAVAALSARADLPPNDSLECNPPEGAVVAVSCMEGGDPPRNWAGARFPIVLAASRDEILAAEQANETTYNWTEMRRDAGRGYVAERNGEGPGAAYAVTNGYVLLFESGDFTVVARSMNQRGTPISEGVHYGAPFGLLSLNSGASVHNFTTLFPDPWEAGYPTNEAVSVAHRVACAGTSGEGPYGAAAIYVNGALWRESGVDFAYIDSADTAGYVAGTMGSFSLGGFSDPSGVEGGYPLTHAAMGNGGFELRLYAVLCWKRALDVAEIREWSERVGAP